jgi:ATP-dependent DNA helicase RecG
MGEDRLNAIVDTILGRQCEDQTIEVKSAHGGTPKLYDSLSSFSNQADGGSIILGIDEASGYSIVGVSDPQQLQKDIVEQCKEIEPPIRPTLEVTERDGKVIVGAFIDGLPMSKRPAYRRVAGITKGSFTRSGDQDLHMTAGELYEIDAFKNGMRDDISVSADSSHEQLDPDRVSTFLARAKADRPHFSHRSANEVLGLSGVERSGKPTLAGLVTLSDYPQQVYPNLCVTAIAVAGTSISQDDSGERFLDNKRFEGSIDQMIEDAMSFVRRNTRTRVLVDEGQRTDISEYPENAVREVITNSLMHRDYGPYSNGTPTRLILFSDRLECWNPGGVYGGQSVDDLGYANVQTRNPTLVSILEILDVAENRHSGIPVIRDEMRRIGLRPPVFLDSRGSFTVRLYNSPENSEQSLRTTGDRLSRKTVLAFCDIPRSRQEVADHFDSSPAYVAHAYLNPLADSGELLRTLPKQPRSKSQRFVARKRG